MNHAANWAVRLIAAALTLGLLAACATVPEPLTGEFASITPEQSDDRHLGSRVRWGGKIIDTRPGREETCIEILARDLDDRARPRPGDADEGRFLACRDGFRDPAVFDSGRAITVIGTLENFVEGRIGEFRYVYPRVAADTLFLWAEQPDVIHYRDPWYYDPWWPYHGFPWRWHSPRHGLSGHIIITP